MTGPRNQQRGDPTFYLLICFVLFTSVNAFLPTQSLADHNNFNKGRLIIIQRRITHGRLRPPNSLSASQTSTDNTPHTKTAEEEKFIKRSLLENALFTGMPDDSLQALIDAFEKNTASQGENIIRQGDSCKGGYVYLVAEGTCRILVDEVMVPEPYGIIGPKSLFGELGVLYEDKRAATITVNSDKLMYYRVDGNTFKTVLNKPVESLATMHEIDAAINQISGTQALYGGNIIPPYKPERIWLWQQYAGTVLKISTQTVFLSMTASAAFVIFARYLTGEPLFALDFTPPDKSLPFLEFTNTIRQIWEIQKALTTFVLTFFVNQSYVFWREVYQLARETQGKLAGFHLVCATNVVRDENGVLTAESEKFLDDIGQYSRLFHVLHWAGKAKRFEVLCTTEGLKRMESRGLISERQLEVLSELDVPKDQLCAAPLEWMMIRANQAIADGYLSSDNATKSTLLREYAFLRNTYTGISAKVNGRMPLAYVHFVQILVDVFVLITPIALYADLGEYSVIAVGLVALFYTGLNNLAKIFLDPLNNENFCENSIFMDLGVLIREANGDSTKWKKSGAKVPF